MSLIEDPVVAQDVAREVRSFLTETFYVSDPDRLTDDLSLIDSGIVDSTGMMDVILFIEERFGVHVEDAETTPENLETIGRISEFVARKRKGTAG